MAGVLTVVACLGGCRERASEETVAGVAEGGGSQELAARLLLSDADVQRVAELQEAARKTQGRAAPEALETPGSAKLFTFMAVTSDEPAVVEAGLEGMVRGNPGKEAHLQAPYEVYVQAVVKNLPSELEGVSGWAVQAARLAMRSKQPSDELLDAVAAEVLRRQDGPVAYELLHCMKGMPRSRREQVTTALSDALGAKTPYVLAEGLAGLVALSRHLRDITALRPRVFALAKHDDPGVRGRALSLLAVIAAEESEAVDLALAGLADEAPYVRASAARALAQLGRPAAIHELMPLIDDEAHSTTVIDGWQRPTGEAGRLELSIGSRRRVDEVALTTLAILSEGRLEPMTLTNDATWMDVLRAQREATREWYTTTKASIPTGEAIVVRARRSPVEPRAAAVRTVTAESEAQRAEEREQAP